MFSSILLKVFLALLCVHSAVQRTNQGRHFEIDPDDDDNDDGYNFDNVKLPLQPRRPPHPAIISATTKIMKSQAKLSTPASTKRPTTSSPTIACPSSSQPLPQLVLPSSPSSPMLTAGSSSEAGWRARADWLFDRGPDGPVTGGLVTVSGVAAVQAIRVLPAALPFNCPEKSSDSSDSMSATDSSSSLAGLAAAHNCEAALATSAAGANCVGQLVSDGRQLMSGSGGGSGSNAHFGVTDAGELFFGFPDYRLRKLDQFKQLVSGSGWLVRNGKNFVSSSLRFEACSRPAGLDLVGSSAAAAAAAAAPSSRSAIGQNQAGELALVHVVGRPGIAGLSLSSFADLLIRLGMRNAVGLDAAGASGLVVNGTLIGSPSAACGSSSLPIACLRPAATVLCVARRSPPLTRSSSAPQPAAVTKVGEASCRDADGVPCSPNGGRCDSSGRCVCMPYFEGPGCARRRCLCLNGGVCHLPDSEACRCPPGYTGSLCELACPAGFYGQDCARVCVCAGGESVVCNPVNGTCAGVSELARNESSLLHSIQQRLRRLGSINVVLVGLSSALSLSLLFNLCLLVQCCRLRCRRRRLEQHQTGGGKSRYQPMRLVPPGRESDSDHGAVM